MLYLAADVVSKARIRTESLYNPFLACINNGVRFYSLNSDPRTSQCRIPDLIQHQAIFLPVNDVIVYVYLNRFQVQPRVLVQRKR